MKTKLPLFFATTAALGASMAFAQEENRPPAPPPPAGQHPPEAPGDRPAPPPPRDNERRGPGGDGERRPEGLRPDAEAPPRDGDRGPRGWHDGDRGRRDGERGEGRGGPIPLRPQKPTPYLGVATVPVPPPLGAQLNLPEGFGLLVEQVVPDSPAAKAGLQRHDVLKLLGDQQLVTPEQLAALVRAAGKDADVALTVVRKGAEEKVTVKVGEKLLPERPDGGRFGDFHWRVEPLRQFPEAARDAARRGEEQGRRLQEHLRTFQQRMNDFQKRLRDWQKDPKGAPPEAPKLDLPKPPESPAPEPSAAPEPPRPADLLRESRPGGAPQVRIDQDGNVTTWNTAQARLVIRDDRGEIQLRGENGRRFAVVKDAAGALVFEGPVDTPEQRNALPEDIRRKIELHGIETLVQAKGPHDGISTAEAFAGETPSAEPAPWVQ